jgi:tripeptide aminopeptidase
VELTGYINKTRLIDTFLELVKVNSPSFMEEAIGALLREKLEKVGCAVELQQYDGSFNIIASKAGTKPGIPPLILSGHMDTIESTEGIMFSTENDVIRTTGKTVLGADDKSALAEILEALAVLKERELPHGDIEIVFSSAEEKGLCGAKNLDFSKLRGTYAIVLDSSGPVGSAVFAAPTQITYEMTITGRAAHAGIEPERGISSIRTAAKIISRVPDGRVDNETTANIGVISGGTATNVVPKETLIRGEIRSHNEETLKSIRRDIFDNAREAAKEDRAQLEISEIEEYRSFRIEEDEPFLSFLKDVFRYCGIELSLMKSGGGSDANVFHDKGIMAVNLSSGMQGAHSIEEFIETKDLVHGCLVVLKTVAEFGLFIKNGGSDD